MANSSITPKYRKSNRNGTKRKPTVWISIWQFFLLSISSIWKYFTFSFLYGLHLHTHHNLTSLYFTGWRSHSGIHFRFGINHFIDHKIYNRIFNIHLAINALIIEIITKCSLSLTLRNSPGHNDMNAIVCFVTSFRSLLPLHFVDMMIVPSARVTIARTPI